MSYQYDMAGRVVLKSRENGTVTALGHDAANQLLATAHYDAAPAVLDSVAYGYDSVGRRLYAKYAGDIGDRFGYDAIDQVVDVQYDVVDPDTSPGPGASYEESEYDPMGNRLEFDDNGAVDTYEPNNLNQYAEIDDVALSYDLNGNLTEDNSGKVYTWDGENRLLSVQPDSPTNGDIRVEYTYDAGSRRVKAVNYERVGGQWSVVRSRFFCYDAWNVLEEHHYDAADQLLGVRYYTWGSDLSGSMQGAGGIGGLVMTEDTVGTNALYYYHFDGNGNVILLSDHAGAASATYRYAAFGRTRLAAGPHAALNRYRFSTKPVEEATGLYYYGLRYYSPELGRWMSRDPIGERLPRSSAVGPGGNTEADWHDRGEPNLYTTVLNMPTRLVDPVGNTSQGTGKPSTPKQKRDCNTVIYVGHGFEAWDWAKWKKLECGDAIVGVCCGRDDLNRLICRDFGKGHTIPYAPGGNLRCRAYRKELDATYGAAIKNLAAKCSAPESCCKSVTITIRCSRFGEECLDLFKGEPNCNDTETVQCGASASSQLL